MPGALMLCDYCRCMLSLLLLHGCRPEKVRNLAHRDALTDLRRSRDLLLLLSRRSQRSLQHSTAQHTRHFRSVRSRLEMFNRRRGLGSINGQPCRIDQGLPGFDQLAFISRGHLLNRCSATCCVLLCSQVLDSKAHCASACFFAANALDEWCWAWVRPTCCLACPCCLAAYLCCAPVCLCCAHESHPACTYPQHQTGRWHEQCTQHKLLHSEYSNSCCFFPSSC